MRLKKGFVFREKKGFTLIEMLVVIAIISLLATIVIVSVQKSIQSAKDARRKADIKSLKTAIEQYANNNRGQYPQKTGANTCGFTTWEGCAFTVSDSEFNTLLQPYLNPVPNDPRGATSAQNYYYVKGPAPYGYGLRIYWDAWKSTDAATVNNCLTGSGLSPSWWSGNYVRCEF